MIGFPFRRLNGSKAATEAPSSAEKPMRFTLRGQEFLKTKKDFVDAAKKAGPGRIQKYSLTLDGTNYPIRQILAAATGLQPIEITSQDAYRILVKFGFSIEVWQ